MAHFRADVDDPIWNEVREFVARCISRCSGHTPYGDQELSVAATKLSVWVWETAGFDLEVAVVFRRDVIANYIATGATEYKPAGRGNLRSQLLRMAEVLLPEASQRRLPPLPASDPTRPYTAKQLQSLRAWAEGHSTSARVFNARVLLALGCGAGLSAVEIGNVRVADITVDNAGVIVNVTHDRKREVPVLRDWEAALVDRVHQLSADRWAFRENHTAYYPNLVSNFVNRSNVIVVRPQVQRMRTTWITRHLAAGTPAKTLIAAAGVESLGALSRYLQFVEKPTPSERRWMLRDPGLSLHHDSALE